MSVCPIDEKGYCSRHQTVHYGRLLEISQMDTEFGENYRRLWDGRMKAPGLISFAKPVVTSVLPGPPRPCRCGETCGGRQS